jgi:Sec-independent protein translocase protein TatA
LRRKRLAERNATCVRSFRSIRRLTRRDDNEIDYRVQSKRRSQQQTTATNILSREGERERESNKQTNGPANAHETEASESDVTLADVRNHAATCDGDPFVESVLYIK